MPAKSIVQLGLVAALLVTVFSVGDVRAAEADTQSISVSLRGLNLETPAGVTALRQRIAEAARTVCGWADQRDLTAIADIRTCRANALAASTLQVEAARSVSHERFRLARAESQVALRGSP